MYARTRTTDATTEPVSTSDAKLFLRVLDETTDDEVAALVKAARMRVENECEIALINQTWTLKCDSFPDCFWLPRPPLSSVTSITYLDGSGVSQTLASSVYTVDTTSRPGRVYLAYGQTWPTTYSVRNAVTVTYVAGFGSTAASVPAPLVHAVKVFAAHYHEHREPVVVGTSVSPMPESAMSLIHAYRMPEVEVA